LALGGLAIFGGEALRNFSIALIFGIVIGTYSSIYVASPIILLWGVKRGEDDAKTGNAKGGKATPASRP
jgi:preprotein translocase subunit SecF